MPQLATVYKEMANNASGENAASAIVEADCWKVVTRTLKTFFKQVRKVRVHAESAIQCGDPSRSMGMFLNAALQELRLEEELMEKGWCKHPLIQPEFSGHMFESYVPRSELKASSGGNAELKRKQNEALIVVGNHAKALDKLSSRMGTVEERTLAHGKRLKRKKGGGVEEE